MSNPANPLSQYHTYSYHHVLLACEHTEVAEAIESSNQFITFMRDSNVVDDPDNPYAKYNVHSVIRNGQPIGKYTIIINGMTDAEFVISKVSWDTTVGTDSGPNGYSRFTTYGSHGTMTIEEPRGVKFMNVMKHATKKMSTDPNGIIYLLKTIFIGHTSSVGLNNTDEQDNLGYGNVYDPITNIRPLLFNIGNITGKFDVTGGTYVIDFSALNNGATKRKHIMRAAQNITLNFGSGGEGRSLAAGLRKLQRRINNDYKKYFKIIKERVERTVDSNNNKINFNGREVEYIIQAEEPYVKKVGTNANGTPVYRDNDDYVITDFKTQNTEKGKKDEAGIISFGKSYSIEDAISNIVHRCKKVKEDLVHADNSDIGLPVQYIPKIATTIKSDGKKYQVIFKLRRVMVIRRDILDQLRLVNFNKDRLKNDKDLSTLEEKNIRKTLEDIERNTLQLYYFYSGKNTDIIDFDIKMENGLNFFQALLSTDTMPDPFDSILGTSPKPVFSPDSCISKEDTGDKTDKTTFKPLQNVNPNTPIFYYTKFDDMTTKNTTDAKLTTSYQQLLNRQGAIESLGVQVKIHGNPGLLNATNKTPSEVLNHSNRNETKADPKTDLFPYWETTPAIVKIDIRMPGGDNDIDYTLPFWYDGYYYCNNITHSFDGGEFTQSLYLIAHQQEGPGCPPAQSETDESKAEQTKTAQGEGAGIGGTGISASSTNSQTSNQVVAQSETPADVNPEEMPASDYLKAFFKQDIFPGCKIDNA